jgi:hypothetical protein
MNELQAVSVLLKLLHQSSSQFEFGKSIRLDMH